jgi:hypothetical protein
MPAAIPLTLAQLHDVLQIAMGWEDGHMHEFRIGQRRSQYPGMPRQSSGGQAGLPSVQAG